MYSYPLISKVIVPFLVSNDDCLYGSKPSTEAAELKSSISILLKKSKLVKLLNEIDSPFGK